MSFNQREFFSPTVFTSSTFVTTPVCDFLDGWSQAEIELITSGAGTASPTLSIYIQGSYDGGQNWVDIGHFNDVTTTASQISLMTVRARTSSDTTATWVSTDGTMSVGVHYAIFPNMLRAKIKQTGTACTFTAQAYISLRD